MERVSLQKVMTDAIEGRLTDVHTCLPGKVVKVDVTKAKVDVQPVLKRKYADESIVELPVITNVPLALYRAGEAFISLPVKVGDFVMLMFSERSLDIWLSKGGTVDPADPRKFHLSDAIAYPGVYPFTDPPTGATADDIVIKNGDASLIVKPGALELYGNGDAIALASKVMAELNAIKSAFDGHTHITSCGAGPGEAQAPTVPMPSPGSVASTKVKAE